MAHLKNSFHSLSSIEYIARIMPKKIEDLIGVKENLHFYIVSKWDKVISDNSKNNRKCIIINL